MTFYVSTFCNQFNLFSADGSIHAVAATKTLLNYCNIPYIVCVNSEQLEESRKWLEHSEEGQNFSGAVLVFAEFNNVVKAFDDDVFAGIYSSHGTAYLSRNEYVELLKDSAKIIRKGGVFLLLTRQILSTQAGQTPYSHFIKFSTLQAQKLN